MLWFHSSSSSQIFSWFLQFHGGLHTLPQFIEIIEHPQNRKEILQLWWFWKVATLQYIITSMKEVMLYAYQSLVEFKASECTLKQYWKDLFSDRLIYSDNCYLRLLFICCFWDWRCVFIYYRFYISKNIYFIFRFFDYYIILNIRCIHWLLCCWAKLNKSVCLSIIFVVITVIITIMYIISNIFTFDWISVIKIKCLYCFIMFMDKC